MNPDASRSEPQNSGGCASELGLSATASAAASASAFEAALYARYVTALALLCECAPYVDEPDYVERIGEVLAQASANYPLEWRRSGGHFEIALRTGIA